jgi:membrane dipeptidase
MHLIDLHCDTLSAILDKQQGLFRNTCHFDLERALAGGLKVQFMAIFVEPQAPTAALEKVCRQMEYYQEQLQLNQGQVYGIKSMEDLQKHWAENKIGTLLHLEGAEAIGQDLQVLHFLYEAGLRSIGLTWNPGNLLSGGIGDGPEAAGLTPWGRVVVREIENLGIILDAAHISVAGFFDLLDIYHKPLVVTHANSRALCDHRRNLSDQQLLALKENGGIIGITQVNDFVNKDHPSLTDLLDHISYIAELIGVKHLALGSDFDGADDIVMSGIEEYSTWPQLLKGRGFSNQEISMILYENALTIMKKILK